MTAHSRQHTADSTQQTAIGNQQSDRVLPTAYCRLPSGTRGQASLEMTLAMIGALLLLFGSLKVYLWINERLVSRQLAYEATRVAAGSTQPGVFDNSASQLRLDLFPGD